MPLENFISHIYNNAHDIFVPFSAPSIISEGIYIHFIKRRDGKIHGREQYILFHFECKPRIKWPMSDREMTAGISANRNINYASWHRQILSTSIILNKIAPRAATRAEEECFFLFRFREDKAAQCVIGPMTN
jgi:hypothetical protein